MVNKSLGSIARGPGFDSRCRRKCWAVIELFLDIYLYEFILCLVRLCSLPLFRFVLIILSYVIEVNLALVYSSLLYPC